MTTTGNHNRRHLSGPELSKALVRLEDEGRKTNVREYMAKSVLSDRQWSVFIYLKRELASRRLTILAGVPLTAIIDPRKFPQPEDVLWRSSVLFAVVTMAPHGAVRLLVLDSVNDDMERCLDKLEVPYLNYSAILNDGEFSKIILDEIDFQFQSSASAKSLINHSENDVAESLRKNVRIIEYERLLDRQPTKQELRRHFEVSSMKLLQEVALHRFCADGLIGDLLTPDEQHIRAISSVDILIHAPPPLNQPLLALEFDGPHHDNPNQQRKDRLKDAVLVHYGIPLIRISYLDAAFGDQFRNGKSDLHRLYVEGLTELVGTVVWQKQFEDEFAIRADNKAKALHILEDHLARSLFGKPYVELNDEQQKQVDDSTFCSKEEEECRFENSLYHYERDKAIERANEESDWPIDILQYAARPTIHFDQFDRFGAEFTVNIPSGKSLKVTLPKIWVQAKDLDADLLKVRVTSDLLQISADWIRQLIRMNTPAVPR